jgi:four helix bundle protein
MATINKFEELEIWQLARILYDKISVVAKSLKDQKEFPFSEQIKSSSGSMMDNIAEGFERNSRLEFLNSLSISKGEGGELKSQLYRCLDDKYISNEKISEVYSDTDILMKKISAFIIYLNKTTHKGLKFKERVNHKP